MKSLSIVKQDKTHGVHVRSVDIWQGLGYAEHRMLKVIIQRHSDKLERYGVLKHVVSKPASGSKGGRPEKTFLIGESQFTLLVMLTNNNDEAVKFKMLVNDEFWRMREQLSELAQHNKARIDGKVYRRKETDTIKAFIELAKAQGASDGINHLYSTLTTMENKALFILEQKYPNVRDVLNTGQLMQVCVADQIVEKTYSEAVETGMNYKDAYKLAKSRVEEYAAIVGKSPIYLLEQQP